MSAQVNLCQRGVVTIAQGSQDIGGGTKSWLPSAEHPLLVRRGSAVREASSGGFQDALTGWLAGVATPYARWRPS